MVEVQITREWVFRIWWAFMWRAMLIFPFLGFLLGLLVVVACALMGKPGWVLPANYVVGWLGFLAVSIWALKVTFNRRHAGHRLVLVREA